MSILLPNRSTDAFQVFRLNMSGADRPLSHLYPAASPALSHPSPASLHPSYNDLFVPCPPNLPLLHLSTHPSDPSKGPFPDRLGPGFMLSYHPTLLSPCIIAINFMITNLISVPPPPKFQETESVLTSISST